jgi:hypothetical protein
MIARQAFTMVTFFPDKNAGWVSKMVLIQEAISAASSEAV